MKTRRVTKTRSFLTETTKYSLEFQNNSKEIVEIIGQVRSYRGYAGDISFYEDSPEDLLKSRLQNDYSMGGVNYKYVMKYSAIETIENPEIVYNLIEETTVKKHKWFFKTYKTKIFWERQ